MCENLLKKIEEDSAKTGHPDFKSGDTIKVSVQIKEGNKTRIQPFEGIVIARRGSGMGETFMMRKISHGVGVERIFPLHCPNVKKIEVIKKGKVRRKKLFYLRDRQGKAAKVQSVIS